jgi:hypothetical protein
MCGLLDTYVEGSATSCAALPVNLRGYFFFIFRLAWRTIYLLCPLFTAQINMHL